MFLSGWARRAAVGFWTCALLTSSAAAWAQDVESFYRGRTINLIVPSAGGGVFELSSQLVARHLGKFIPGAPTIVVQTQPGTSGIALGNRFASGSDRDGLTIGFMSRAAPQFPMVGDRNAHYDAMKFVWLGSISSYVNDAYMFVVNSDNKIRNVEDIRRAGPATPVGANRTGSATVTFALLAKEVLQFNIQVVRGFPGAAEVTLAMQRHEVEGVTSDVSAFAGSGAMHDMWANGRVRPIVQFGRLTRLASLPDVPTGRELVTDPADRALLEFAEMPFFMAFPFAAPAGIPEDRARALQAGFLRMVRDPDFLADAKRINIDISAIDGPAILKLIDDASRTPKDVLARFKAMIGD